MSLTRPCELGWLGSNRELSHRIAKNPASFCKYYFCLRLLRFIFLRDTLSLQSMHSPPTRTLQCLECATPLALEDRTLDVRQLSCDVCGQDIPDRQECFSCNQASRHSSYNTFD